MAKQKWYVVWVGKEPGLYITWDECKRQVDGFDGAKYKSYESKSEAEIAYAAGWKKTFGQAHASGGKAKKAAGAASGEKIDYDSISVDVGTAGNPGPVEYKGVDTQTGDVLFSVGPISKGTNNLGEFLAIVHGLAYLQKLGSAKTIYSDSVNAINWVKKKEVASTLVRDASTAEIWRLVDRAVHWLKTNPYKNKVAKWQTKEWGEIKADYGRK
ncbi:ribonuclease H [Cohnella sp. GCM10027633]|uniref:ribonuclease H n=1 Tax=unclassified Cohnella TaxID=2636738 RepID=UPI00362A6770